VPLRLPRAALTAVLVLSFGLGTPLHPVRATPSAAAATSVLPRISFAAPPGVTILVHGTYPKVSSTCVRPGQPLLHARYSGTIEVGKDTDGSLFVIGELPFEDYLKGIAEVPRTWPMDALKAQVVAARTYALSRIGIPDSTAARLGYQLCVTDHCQVYRGEGIAGGPYGDRWRNAVNSTAREALLYKGRPADTVYFSTSNGTTHTNAEIFGSDPLPYLKAVPETDDGASGLSHWHTSIPFGDVDRFLTAGGDWPSDAKVTTVERNGSTVIVSGTLGKKKTSRSLDVVEFRTALNSWAHCLKPDSYPTVDAGSRLPQTVPSRWFSLRASGGRAVLDGRGWGHGVGMVQWGAYGKAQRGVAFDDILAHYYGGLRPEPYGGEPDTIRVGIATGLKSVRVAPSGDVAITGRTLRPGPWLISGGKKLRIHQAGPPPSYLAAGTLRGPGRAEAGQGRHATVDIPATSVVQLVLTSNRHDIVVSSARTYEAGSTRIAWTAPEAPSGSYSLQAVVTDGIDIVRTNAVKLRLKGLPVVTLSLTPSPSTSVSPSSTAAPSPTPTPIDNGRGRARLVLIVSAIGALILGAFSFIYLYRKTGGSGKGPLPPWERFEGGPPG
jgi:stage II sporulation protein D